MPVAIPHANLASRNASRGTSNFLTASAAGSTSCASAPASRGEATENVHRALGHSYPHRIRLVRGSRNDIELAYRAAQTGGGEGEGELRRHVGRDGAGQIVHKDAVAVRLLHLYRHRGRVLFAARELQRGSLDLEGSTVQVAAQGVDGRCHIAWQRGLGRHDSSQRYRQDQPSHPSATLAADVARARMCNNARGRTPDGKSSIHAHLQGYTVTEKRKTTPLIQALRHAR